MTLKSILKKTAPPRPGPVAEAADEALTDEQRRERNRSAAIEQATVIHAQKSAELDILASIEHFLDFPIAGSQPGDPAKPAAQDVVDMRTRLAIFQPSDFDALIEERHAAGRCGYVLCGRPPRRAPPGTGKFVFQRSGAATNLPGSGPGSKIIDRAQFETWCSDSCIRRAMYIKAQLLQEPAALRGLMHVPPVELLAEDGDGDGALAQVDPNDRSQPPVRSIRPSERPDVKAGLDDLAEQQGRPGRTTAGPANRLVSSTIVHRDTVRPPVPPSADSADPAGAIEGYLPLTRTRWIDSKPEAEIGKLP